MFFFKLLFLLFLQLIVTLIASEGPEFIYNGFKDAANLSLDGLADITPDGLLRLTNATKYQMGHAFYLHPLQFKNNVSSSSVEDSNTINTVSFSTTFVFGIVSDDTEISGQGLAFVIAPQRGLPGAKANQFLGLFNESSNGQTTNHVVAVELDTIYNLEFDSIEGNHVGIDINDLQSIKSVPPSYFTDGEYKTISLSGARIQVWVEYDGVKKQLNVTIAPIKASKKPDVPILSVSQDLSTIFLDSMYVGFSASTQTALTSHYVLGWSLKINGKAQALDLSILPELPQFSNKKQEVLKIGLSIILPISVLVMIIGIYSIVKMRKFDELVEDWELTCGTRRFSYKDLYDATNGFGEKEVVGRGAFGKVYRGVLPTSRTKVAVKKVSHDSTYGLQQFIAEIVTLGKLRHRNLVPLLGYCRRKGELLLVYDFMPNGSLDHFLFGQLNSSSSSSMLNWSMRFQIIKGVASGLYYLHEEWEQVVIHRDIKASNVLLDGEMNARLGDFGLAMLFDHGTNDAITSKLVGTPGYLAPEMSRIGMASINTDVYAFGAFLLEVACGRRPLVSKTSTPGERLGFLVDWVLSCWRKDAILQTSDPNLGSEYVVEEMELVLKLGLLCAHSDPEFRPTMRQVMQYLNGDVALLQSDLWALETCDSVHEALTHGEHFGDLYPISAHRTYAGSSSAPSGLVPSGARS